MCGQKSPFVSVLTNIPKSVIILGGNCCFMQTLWSRGHTFLPKTHFCGKSPSSHSATVLVPQLCEGWEVVNHGFKSIVHSLRQMLSLCKCSHSHRWDLSFSVFHLPLISWLFSCTPGRPECTWIPRDEVADNRAQIHLEERSALPCAHPGACHLVPIFPWRKERKSRLRQERA